MKPSESPPCATEPVPPPRCKRPFAGLFRKLHLRAESGRVAGVEIAQRRIRIAEGSWDAGGGDGRFRLDRLWEAPLPVAEGSAGEQAPRLEGCRLPDWLRGREISVALEGADVKSALLEMNPLRRREFDRAVGLRMRKAFPEMTSTPHVVRHLLLGRPGGPPGGALRVLGIAAPRERVREAADLVLASGIAGFDLGVEVVVLENLLKTRAREEGDPSEAILHLGWTSSTLGIYRAGNLAFRHTVKVGLGDLLHGLTESISGPHGTFQLTLEEAFRFLTNHPIAHPGEVEIRPGVHLPAERLHSLVRPCLERLEQDLARCFRLHHQIPAAASVPRLMITGDGAMVRGLDEYLAHSLALEVLRLGDLAGIDTGRIARDCDQPPGHLETFAVAIACALQREPTLDMVPGEQRRAERLRVLRRVVRYAAVAMLLLGCLLFTGQRAIQGVLSDTLAASRRHLAALAPAFEALERLQALRAGEQTLEGRIGATLAPALRPSAALKEIARSAGEQALLDTLEIDFTAPRGRIRIDGAVLDAPRAPSTIDEVSRALSESPLLGEITMEILDRNATSGPMRFSISGVLELPPADPAGEIERILTGAPEKRGHGGAEQ